jgi:hypothetical protein
LIAWQGLSLLAFHVGPLVLLAGDFGYRMKGRKQVGLIAGMGIALPFCVTMLFVALVGLATLASGYYLPSLQPTVAMALWSKAAGSALPGRMAIAAMTMFGAVRFGAMSLRSSVSLPVFGRRLPWVILGCLSGIVAWCSLHPFDTNIETSFNASATCLGVTAAALTADFVSGTRRVRTVRRIDWVGFGALVAGLATAYGVTVGTAVARANAWWQPGLLPAYGAGFAACLLGRTLQRKFASRLRGQLPPVVVP